MCKHTVYFASPVQGEGDHDSGGRVVFFLNNPFSTIDQIISFTTLLLQSIKSFYLQPFRRATRATFPCTGQAYHLFALVLPCYRLNVQTGGRFVNRPYEVRRKFFPNFVGASIARPFQTKSEYRDG